MNIINLRMFSGDPLSIETHLNNDWSLLLRNIKTKEELLLELLHYNHKIVTQVREQNTQLFVNDQILQHQKQLNKIVDTLEALEKQQTEIYQKYEGTSVHQQRAIKLMSRVGARIFEIYHNSIEKCKSYDESLNQKYIKMKKLLIQLLNQDNLDLDQIVKCVTKYSKEKILNQIEKLKRLIAALQNGDYTKLKDIYAPKERKIVRSSERKIDVLRDLSKAKAEKEAAKTQQKQQQKIKKQKQKLMNNLYSTMQLSKQQFHDDDNNLPEARIEKLYNQILSRNRYNSQQIIQFHSKKDLFEQKVKAFKQMMQKQSKKITQVFIRKPIKRQKAIQPPVEIEKHSITIDNHQASTINYSQSNIENIMTEGNIDNIKLQKRLMNTQNFKLKSVSTKKQINDLPNIFNSFLATNQNFSNFKFDLSNRDIYTRTGRNIFPDIVKGTSLDHKTQITKIKIDKILRTTIKNDDKLHEVSQRKHQNSRKTAVISREQAKMAEQSHRIRLNVRNIDLSVNAEGTFKRVMAEKQRVKVDSIYDDHGLHVKKAELKYYQPKLNILL